MIPYCICKSFDCKCILLKFAQLKIQLLAFMLLVVLTSSQSKSPISNLYKIIHFYIIAVYLCYVYFVHLFAGVLKNKTSGKHSLGNYG